MNKSCQSCPSFIGGSDHFRQDTAYDSLIGVPTCARTGNLLGSDLLTSSEEEELQTTIAGNCVYYGKPVDSTQSFITLKIGVGVPKVNPKENTARVTTCRSCFFYVQADVIQKRLGVGLGMCAKFGNLIPSGSNNKIASSCSSGALLDLDVEGEGIDAAYKKHQEDLIDSVTLNPILGQFFQEFGATGNLFSKKEEAKFVDPVDYPTDAPVRPEHIAKGIRAWRKLTEAGRSVYIPVFDVNFFDAIEQSKIPRTGDDEHPEKYIDHQNLAFTMSVLMRELDETPALSGKAGVGKTEAFRYLAWLMCIPFERISITNSTELDELVGRVQYSPEKGTYFQYGRLPIAWQKPCVIVLDEPNTGPPDVWQFLRPLTDNSKQFILDQDNGQVIKRHDHTYLGMAFNPSWDTKNIGAEPISDADGSRLMHIFVTMPPSKIERIIITERCEIDGYDISDDTLDKIMNIAESLRRLEHEGVLSISWGIRHQIKVARASKWFDLRKSYRLAIADLLEPQQSDMILDIVRSHDR